MSGLVQDTEAVLEIGETTTAEVVADTDAILQVLSNLIENAIKYGQGPQRAALQNPGQRTRGIGPRRLLLAPAAPSSSAFATSAPALPPSTSIASSSASTGSTRPAPGSPAAPALVSAIAASHGADAWRLHSSRKRAQRRQHLHLYPSKSAIFRRIMPFSPPCNLPVTIPLTLNMCGVLTDCTIDAFLAEGEL